ncbi:MAG TPA: hypothetical protein VFX59_31645, partial [Polyangiales bacterium]|nr:hypothetical protein [Polyangiales bacterium]
MELMPWLYFSAPPHIASWARAWQQEVHADLTSVEAVELHPDCFVAAQANVFAEPRRTVRVGPGASIAAHAFVHGPVTLEANASV